jgi:hypothetical protein
MNFFSQLLYLFRAKPISTSLTYDITGKLFSKCEIGRGSISFLGEIYSASAACLHNPWTPNNTAPLAIVDILAPKESPSSLSAPYTYHQVQHESVQNLFPPFRKAIMPGPT